MVPDYRIFYHCKDCREQIQESGLCRMGCKKDGQRTLRNVIVVSYKKDKEREEERVV